jgi:hypothetical protein
LDGEEPHPSNCRGCSHAKEEIRKRESQRAPKTTYNGKGVLFQPHHPRTILRGGAAQQHTATTAASAAQACAATLFQQIMTGLSGTNPEEDKIVADPEIVCKFMK